MDAAVADGFIGAFLRAVGPSEPRAVIRVGDGARAGMADAICSFFGVDIIEAPVEENDEVSAPLGAEFAGLVSARGRIVTTRSEVPIDADPSSLSATVQRLRVEGNLP